jgi:hypothetical protein
MLLIFFASKISIYYGLLEVKENIIDESVFYLEKGIKIRYTLIDKYLRGQGLWGNLVFIMEVEET